MIYKYVHWAWMSKKCDEWGDMTTNSLALDDPEKEVSEACMWLLRFRGRDKIRTGWEWPSGSKEC